MEQKKHPGWENQNVCWDLETMKYFPRHVHVWEITPIGRGGVKNPVFELTEFVDEPLGSCHVSKEASVCFAKFYPLPPVGNYQKSVQTPSLQISKSEHFLE